MHTHQDQFQRVLSSIGVGVVTFCVIAFLALISGGLLLGQLQTEVLFPPELKALFWAFGIVGLVLSVFAGVKYYRYTGRSQ